MEISNIINVTILVTLLILTLGFFFYKRIVNVSLLFIKILFPVSVAIALVTLFLPQLYSNFVVDRFSTTILAQNLKSVDKTLTQVSRVQISFSNTIKGILNNGSQELLEEYESNLYKQVTEFMTGTLRIIVLILSIIILIFALYIRYSFSGSFESILLQKEINMLKKEVEVLKSKAS